MAFFIAFLEKFITLVPYKWCGLTPFLPFFGLTAKAVFPYE